MKIKPLIILGAGGHAKVVLDLISDLSDLAVEAIVAPEISRDPLFANITLLPSDQHVLEYPNDSVMLINGIGSIGVSEKRRRIYEYYKDRGYVFHILKHNSAIVSRSAALHEGTQIMAGCVIQTGCSIGVNSIINTRSSIDHDCSIGDHVHVAPGVTLSGGVTVGSGSHIGTGATVIQGITIGANVTVAAGAVVITNIVDNSIVKGVPAR